MISSRSLALPVFTVVLAASVVLHGSYVLADLRVVTALAVAGCIVSRVGLPRPLLLAFGLLATGLLISWTLTGFSSAAELPALALVFCAALTAVAFTAAQDKSKEAVLDAIVLVTSLAAAAGIVGVAFHVKRFAFLAVSWRASSFLTYQNAAAALFAIGLPAALVRGGKRTAPRVAAVVISVGVAATQSRGGAIAVGVTLIVLLLRERPAALPRLAACSALGFASLLPSISDASWGWAVAVPVLALAMLIAGQAHRITPRASLTVRVAVAVASVAAVTTLTIVATPASHRFATTSNDRTRVWATTIKLIEAHPVVGTGPGTYHVRTFAGDRAIITSRAHNEYLQAASETGILGLALALAAIAVIGLAVMRRTGIAADAALATGVAFLVHSSIQYLWRIPALPALALAYTGIVLARDREPSQP